MTLKPCPFCGGVPGTHELDDDAYDVGCTGCYIVTAWYATKREAHNAWNRRADQPAAWQPIETAPRDGTRVLVLDKDDWQDISGYCYGSWYVDDTEIYPTKWQPLPAAPGDATQRPEAVSQRSDTLTVPRRDWFYILSRLGFISRLNLGPDQASSSYKSIEAEAFANQALERARAVEGGS